MSDDLVKKLQTHGDVLRHIEAQAARIAELEATLRQFFDAEMDAIVKRILGAKVAGGKDE